jgi:L-asparagine transporter-like permease
MPGYPYTNWMTMIFLGFVVFAMAIDDAHRISLFVGPVWLLILTVIYYKAGFNKVDAVDEGSLKAQIDQD